MRGTAKLDVQHGDTSARRTGAARDRPAVRRIHRRVGVAGDLVVRAAHSEVRASDVTGARRRRDLVRRGPARPRSAAARGPRSSTARVRPRTSPAASLRELARRRHRAPRRRPGRDRGAERRRGRRRPSGGARVRALGRRRRHRRRRGRGRRRGRARQRAPVARARRSPRRSRVNVRNGEAHAPLPDGSRVERRGRVAARRGARRGRRPRRADERAATAAQRRSRRARRRRQPREGAAPTATSRSTRRSRARSPSSRSRSRRSPSHGPRLARREAGDGSARGGVPGGRGATGGERRPPATKATPAANAPAARRGDAETGTRS